MLVSDFQVEYIIILKMSHSFYCSKVCTVRYLLSLSITIQWII